MVNSSSILDASILIVDDLEANLRPSGGGVVLRAPQPPAGNMPAKCGCSCRGDGKRQPLECEVRSRTSHEV